jgi:hypothetical protein
MIPTDLASFLKSFLAIQTVQQNVNFRIEKENSRKIGGNYSFMFYLVFDDLKFLFTEKTTIEKFLQICKQMAEIVSQMLLC